MLSLCCRCFNVGLNNIFFIQISPAKHVHTKFVEDLNKSILLIEFISSCIIYTLYFVHCNSMTNILFKRYCKSYYIEQNIEHIRMLVDA